jgi:hypothetical protein
MQNTQQSNMYHTQHQNHDPYYLMLNSHLLSKEKNPIGNK